MDEYRPQTILVCRTIGQNTRSAGQGTSQPKYIHGSTATDPRLPLTPQHPPSTSPIPNKKRKRNTVKKGSINVKYRASRQRRALIGPEAVAEKAGTQEKATKDKGTTPERASRPQRRPRTRSSWKGPHVSLHIGKESVLRVQTLEQATINELTQADFSQRQKES
ncbi:MAG: hypothetical protein Q9217_006266 [Psora testacea]